MTSFTYERSPQTWVDAIHDLVNDMIEQRQIEELNRTLLLQTIGVLPTIDVSISWLAATLPIKSQLPHRKLFYDREHNTLTLQYGVERANQLLKGLE